MEVYGPMLRVFSANAIPRQIAGQISPSDLVQITFVDMVNGIHHCKADCAVAFQSWLKKLIKNNLIDLVRRLCISQKREASREVTLSEGVLSQFAESGDHLRPSFRVRNLEFHQMIHVALEQLSPAHKQLIVWRDIDGKSWNEIAAKVDRTVGAVQACHKRAIEKLRSHLIEFAL